MSPRDPVTCEGAVVIVDNYDDWNISNHMDCNAWYVYYK